MTTYTVTGRIWNPETRQHDKLHSVDFSRRIDATGYMNTNRDWIAGMVMDRDAEAIEQDNYAAEVRKRQIAEAGRAAIGDLINDRI